MMPQKLQLRSVTETMMIHHSLSLTLQAFLLLTWVCLVWSSSEEVDKTVRRATITNDDSLLCRKFPTWKRGTDEEDNMKKCSKEMNYNVDPAILLEGAEDEYTKDSVWMDEIRSCLDKANTPPEDIDTFTILQEPEIVNFFPSKQEAVMATVSFALAPHEAQAVLDLSKCVNTSFPDQYWHRSFYNKDEADEEDKSITPEERGGNDVVFLTGFLQTFLPGVAAQIYKLAHLVYTKANWGNVTKEYYNDGTEPFPNPYKCGIHTSEHLDYRGWAHLGAHPDGGSQYTVLISMSSPDDYEGGEHFLEPSTWNTKRDGSRVVIKPERLSAVVFLSEESHGVQEILGGRREMFTTELWDLDDTIIGDQRPDREDYEDFMEEEDIETAKNSAFAVGP